jgi:hypothetical protein
MYYAPTDFVRRLSDTFNDRLRIRWSIAKQEFHIEQKVLSAALPPFRISEIDDRMIRARDGYHFVMAVKAGNHVPCRTCHLRCRVPELRTGEIRCDYCGTKQRNPKREFGGYWPLNDLLIDHLKKISPENDGHLKAVIEQDRQDVRRETTRKRDIFNHIESATYDDKYQLFDTPFSGYTGKVLPGSSINGHSI